jgi:hypothetical protein
MIPRRIGWGALLDESASTVSATELIDFAVIAAADNP